MPKRVLAVDDDQISLKMIQHALAGGEYEVVARATGGGARESLRVFKFDAILLDLYLPDANGLDLLGQIRRDPKHQLVPVVMLTAEDDLDVADQTRAHGADAYLVKPCPMDRIRAKIDSLVDQTNTYGADRPSLHYDG